MTNEVKLSIGDRVRSKLNSADVGIITEINEHVIKIEYNPGRIGFVRPADFDKFCVLEPQ